MKEMSAAYPDKKFTVALCAKFYGDVCGEIYHSGFDPVFKSIEEAALPNFEFILDGKLSPTKTCQY